MNFGHSEALLTTQFPLHPLGRAASHSAFRPGFVRVGFHSLALHIEAELWDDEIFNDATGPNQLTYLLGDVFEMFFQPEGQAAYFEFHVTPHNQTLQLRWPSAEVFRATKPNQVKPFLCHAPLFQSRTTIEEKLWCATAHIPLASICESPDLRRALATGESDLKFSFSRYDATRGQKPLLSSTSRHRAINFHRIEDWGRMNLLELSKS